MNPCIGLASLVTVLLCGISAGQAIMPDGHLVLERLPEPVVATMEFRDRWFTSTTTRPMAASFVTEDLARWSPGQSVRVAFLWSGATP